jgi:hypothetical protein
MADTALLVPGEPGVHRPNDGALIDVERETRRSFPGASLTIE